MNSQEKQRGEKAGSFVLEGADEPIAAKAAKKVFTAFKTLMSFSGVTLADAREIEVEEKIITPQEREEMFYESPDSDPGTEGMTWEEVLLRSRNLSMEEAIRSKKQSCQTTLSLGDVELCASTSYGTSWGTSHKSISEIESDYASPSCSHGPSDPSHASCSYDIV